jgi:hypothetical protein
VHAGEKAAVKSASRSLRQSSQLQTQQQKPRSHEPLKSQRYSHVDLKTKTEETKTDSGVLLSERVKEGLRKEDSGIGLEVVTAVENTSESESQTSGKSGIETVRVDVEGEGGARRRRRGKRVDFMKRGLRQFIVMKGVKGGLNSSEEKVKDEEESDLNLLVQENDNSESKNTEIRIMTESHGEGAEKVDPVVEEAGAKTNFESDTIKSIMDTEWDIHALRKLTNTLICLWTPDVVNEYGRSSPNDIENDEVEKTALLDLDAFDLIAPVNHDKESDEELNQQNMLVNNIEENVEVNQLTKKELSVPSPPLVKSSTMPHYLRKGASDISLNNHLTDNHQTFKVQPAQISVRPNLPRMAAQNVTLQVSSHHYPYMRNLPPSIPAKKNTNAIRQFMTGAFKVPKHSQNSKSKGYAMSNSPLDHDNTMKDTLLSHLPQTNPTKPRPTSRSSSPSSVLYTATEPHYNGPPLTTERLKSRRQPPPPVQTANGSLLFSVGESAQHDDVAEEPLLACNSLQQGIRSNGSGFGSKVEKAEVWSNGLATLPKINGSGRGNEGYSKSTNLTNSVSLSTIELPHVGLIRSRSVVSLNSNGELTKVLMTTEGKLKSLGKLGFDYQNEDYLKSVCEYF